MCAISITTLQCLVKPAVSAAAVVASSSEWLANKCIRAVIDLLGCLLMKIFWNFVNVSCTLGDADQLLCQLRSYKSNGVNCEQTNEHTYRNIGFHWTNTLYQWISSTVCNRLVACWCQVSITPMFHWRRLLSSRNVQRSTVAAFDTWRQVRELFSTSVDRNQFIFTWFKSSVSVY